MFDELFYLVYPLSLKHIFLDALHCYHQSGHILDQDVISSNQQLVGLLAWRAVSPSGTASSLVGVASCTWTTCSISGIGAHVSIVGRV